MAREAASGLRVVYVVRRSGKTVAPGEDQESRVVGELAEAWRHADVLGHRALLKV